MDLGNKIRKQPKKAGVEKAGKWKWVCWAGPGRAALRNRAEGTGNSTIPILLQEPGGPAWVRRTRRVPHGPENNSQEPQSAVAARGGLGKSPSAAQRRESQPGGPGKSPSAAQKREPQPGGPGKSPSAVQRQEPQPGGPGPSQVRGAAGLGHGRGGSRAVLTEAAMRNSFQNSVDFFL
ncbi:hypothetical protein HispidOSU_015551 [Sigmodon hispidus]